MKANEVNFLKFLQASNQFRIPIYQRTYSWTLDQCAQLWNDIVTAGQDERVTGHFLGSVVYIERGLYRVADVPQLLVIDGQQRMTTVTLLLIALGRALQEKQIQGEISRQKITNYFLINPEETGDLQYKLVLTQSDEKTLKSLVDNQPLPHPVSRRIVDNYRFFEEQLLKSGLDLAQIHAGIRKLIIVQIALDRDHDDPQRIFESLNSTGLKLSQADLIRNYVLMDLEPAEQEQLYTGYWYGMEQSFGQIEPGGLFDRFIRDYLTLISRSGTIPRLDDVYSAFKTYRRNLDDKSTPEVVADIYRYAQLYVRMARVEESDPELRQLFSDIRTLHVDVAYPFLLQVYVDYAAGRITQAGFVAVLNVVESYVFRRAVVGIPTNTLNKTFATLPQYIDPDHYLPSVEGRLLSLTGRQRFPTDEEFRAALVVKDIYNTRTAAYLLGKLETYNRKETANLTNATIEHILPQNANLSSAWQAELGPDWKTVQNTYVHTLGNLTLTGYNSELGDRPFETKRTMQGGYRNSVFHLTRMVAENDHWNAEIIQERAKQLADEALRIWARPALPQTQVPQYRRRSGETTVQPSLSTRPDDGIPATLKEAMTLWPQDKRALFDTLRARILALGPNITEHPYTVSHWTLAHISYRNPSTFVDTVLRKSRIRLILNIPFAKLDDPRGLGRGVTGGVYWGGGQVRVRLSQAYQLDHVVGLIQQAFDWNASTGEDNEDPDLEDKILPSSEHQPGARKWDESSVFAGLTMCCSSAGVSAARHLYDFVLAHGGQAAWGIGELPAVTLRLPIGTVLASAFALYEWPRGKGTFAVNFEYLRGLVPQAALGRLAERIRSVPGAVERLAGVEAADFKKRPTLFIDSSLTAPGGVETIEAAMLELMQPTAAQE